MNLVMDLHLDERLCQAIKAQYADDPMIVELVRRFEANLKRKTYVIAFDGEREEDCVLYSSSDNLSYLKDLLSAMDCRYRIYSLHHDKQFNEYPKYSVNPVDGDIRKYDFDGDDEHRDAELETMFHQLNIFSDRGG